MTFQIFKTVFLFLMKRYIDKKIKINLQNLYFKKWYKNCIFKFLKFFTATN